MRKVERKKHIKKVRKSLLTRNNKIFGFLIICVMVFIGFIDYLNKKPQIDRHLVIQDTNNLFPITTSTLCKSYPTSIPSTETPPLPKEKDWKKYAIGNTEPIINEGDTVERYWSPNKEYYLLRIKPDKIGLFKSQIAVYKSSEEFVFAFNPRTREEEYSGVAKRFHDFWQDNKTIVFNWNDGGYEGDNHYFRYNLDNKTFSLVLQEEFDSDNQGRILIVKRNNGVSGANLYYRSPNDSETSLGHLDGHVDGLSPNGKYLVFLRQDKEDQDAETLEAEHSFYEKVFIAPVEKDGLSKAVFVGKVKIHVGGIEGLMDPLFTIWKEDEKKFTIKNPLTTDNEFLNPLP